MRVIVAFIAVLVLAQPLPSVAADVQSLVATHKSFTGWDSGDAAMASWHLSGTRTSGRETDAFTEYRRGPAFRDRIQTPAGITDETGFTGRYVWHADANNFWTPVYGVPAQAALAWDVVRSEAFTGFPLHVVGTANAGGTACVVLRVEPKGLPIVDLYEIPHSGALARVVVAPGSASPVTFDDIGYLTLASGKRIVANWTTGNVRYAIASATLGNVDDRDLVSEPSPATWSYSDAPAPLTFITITDNARMIHVTASVNGHSGVFVLGTNTPSILLFDPFASQAGVRPMGTSDFSPYVGNLQFEGYGHADTLAVGKAVLRNVVVQRVNAPNAKIAGVLGYDFFAHAIVNVDLARQQLQIEDPQTYQPPMGQGAYAFPLDLTNRVPVIGISLPSGAAAHPSLDSDLNGFMVLSQALYDSHGIGGSPITDETSVIFTGVGATGDPIATPV